MTAIIDYVGSAQLHSELEPFRFKVDAYDRVSADDSCRHDRSQANGSRTENGDALTLPDFQRIDYRACSSLQAATHGSEQLQRQGFGNLDDVAFGSQGVGSEGGLTKKVPAYTAAVQGIIAVQAPEAEVRLPEVLAIKGASSPALSTMAAGLV